MDFGLGLHEKEAEAMQDMEHTATDVQKLIYEMTVEYCKLEWWRLWKRLAYTTVMSEIEMYHERDCKCGYVPNYDA